jgi:hypothetical protein
MNWDKCERRMWYNCEQQILQKWKYYIIHWIDNSDWYDKKYEQWMLW